MAYHLCSAGHTRAHTHTRLRTHTYLSQQMGFGSAEVELAILPIPPSLFQKSILINISEIQTRLNPSPALSNLLQLKLTRHGAHIISPADGTTGPHASIPFPTAHCQLNTLDFTLPYISTIAGISVHI